MHRKSLLAALFLSLAVLLPARAAERPNVGMIGSPSPLSWPFHIGMKKGLFAAAGLEFEVVYTPSAPNLLQQVSAGSLDIAMSTGLVDPIRAIDKGGPVAILLVELETAPYVLMAKPEIKDLAGLKGKIVAVGGFNDITNIYLDRMVAPSGLKRADIDMKFFGNTPARLAALKAGAVDAAMLGQPANFYAAAEGYRQLGLVKDYVTDFPFSGSAVNRNWAAAHPDTARVFLSVYAAGAAWFNDPRNRDEAVAMMVEASHAKTEDVAKSYDFLRAGEFFSSHGTVSRAKLANLVHALHGIGDLDDEPEPVRLIAPGLTPVTD